MSRSTLRVDSMDWNVTGEVTVEDVEGNLVINTSGKGKYQISTCYGKPNVAEFIYETIIDTETGKVISRERTKGSNKYERIDK